MQITPKELTALKAVYDRALDDWLTYKGSGHGPNDFAEQGDKWEAHVIQQDAYMELVEDLIKRLSRPNMGQKA